MTEDLKLGKQEMMKKLAKFTIPEALAHAKVPHLNQFLDRLAGNPAAEELMSAGKAYKDINKFVGQKAEELAPHIQTPGRIDTILSESPEKLINPAMVGAGVGGTAGAMTDTGEDQNTILGTTVHKPGTFGDRIKNILTGAGIGAGVASAGRLNSLSKSNVAQELAGKGPEKITAALKHMSPEQLNSILGEATTKFRPQFNTNYEGFNKSKQYLDEVKNLAEGQFFEGRNIPEYAQLTDRKLDAFLKHMGTNAPTMAKNIELKGLRPEEKVIALNNFNKLDPGKVSEDELQNMLDYLHGESAAGSLSKKYPAVDEYLVRQNAEKDNSWWGNVLSHGAAGAASGAGLGAGVGAAVGPVGVGTGAATGGALGYIGGLLRGNKNYYSTIEDTVRAAKQKASMPTDQILHELITSQGAGNKGLDPEIAQKIMRKAQAGQLGPNMGDLLRRSQM